MVISDFKGTTMISIREYYEKDGDFLPGKKVSCFLLSQASHRFLENAGDLDSRSIRIPCFRKPLYILLVSSTNYVQFYLHFPYSELPYTNNIY